MLQLKQFNNIVRPIGYLSRSINNAKLIYQTTGKECLAIVLPIPFFCSDFRRTRLTIQIDHTSLLRSLDLADNIGCLAGWLLRMSKFKFEIVHKASVEHQALDSPQLLLPVGTNTSTLEANLPLLVLEASDTVTSIVRVNDAHKCKTLRRTKICVILTTPHVNEYDSKPPNIYTFQLKQLSNSYCLVV